MTGRHKKESPAGTGLNLPTATKVNMNQIVHHMNTMSSVELVAIINELREEGRAELRHDHFMAKIEKHPGIDAPKFRGVYIGGNGQERPCYHLPKRECELMVMSESLAVQTKVYDRLSELEAMQIAAPTAPPPRVKRQKAPLAVAASMTPAVMRALVALGINKNAAAISTNQIVAAETGVNLLALAGHTHLPAADNQMCFTPTEMGRRYCKSGIAFNRMLADSGLQESIGGTWVPTERGRRHAVVLDTGKSHGNGTPIQQIKWKESVLAEVAL